MNLGEIFRSKRWKAFTGYVYNIGASIVILGALFKLQHWAYSGPILIVGLCTEAFIFLISAFEPPLEIPEWSKVYPELRDDFDPDLDMLTDKQSSKSSKSGLDTLFDSAEISPDLISKVSKGLTDLSNTASQISDMSAATTATDMYVSNLNNASESMSAFAEMNNQANTNISSTVENLVNSYSNTAASLSDKGSELANKMAISGEEFVKRMDQSGEKLVGSYDKVSEIFDQGFQKLEVNSKSYAENMEKMNKNLEDLTLSYANQLKETNDRINVSKKLFSDMDQLNEMFVSSFEEIKKYQANAVELNKNLEALNSVYGNMLGAMNYKK